MQRRETGIDAYEAHAASRIVSEADRAVGLGADEEDFYTSQPGGHADETSSQEDHREVLGVDEEPMGARLRGKRNTLG